MSILTQIVADKRREIAGRRQVLSCGALQQQALEKAAPVSLVKALRAKRPGIIAEVKRKSPSAGAIRELFDPEAVARAYVAAGTSGISVLMDGPYFGGSEQDFAQVAGCVDVPLLYKEFVVDEWQVWHARTIGAAAVLLIVAALPQADLADLYRMIRQAGMEPLVEVHNAEELQRALDIEADFIGVNNRDLNSFNVTLDTTFQLASMMPAEVTCVSESGIRTSDDIMKLLDAGVHGVLVGEQLLRQPDPGQGLQSLMETAWALQ